MSSPSAAWDPGQRLGIQAAIRLWCQETNRKHKGHSASLTAPEMGLLNRLFALLPYQELHEPGNGMISSNISVNGNWHICPFSFSQRKYNLGCKTASCPFTSGKWKVNSTSPRRITTDTQGHSETLTPTLKAEKTFTEDTLNAFPGGKQGWSAEAGSLLW